MDADTGIEPCEWGVRHQRITFRFDGSWAFLNPSSTGWIEVGSRKTKAAMRVVSAYARCYDIDPTGLATLPSPHAAMLELERRLHLQRVDTFYSKEVGLFLARPGAGPCDRCVNDYRTFNSPCKTNFEGKEESGR